MKHAHALTLTFLCAAALGVGGCAALTGAFLDKDAASPTATVAAKSDSGKATQTRAEPAKSDPADLKGDGADKYCDTLEPSYEMATNLKSMVSKLSPSLIAKIAMGAKVDLSEAITQVSKSHVWIPLKIEQAIGDQLHAKKMRENTFLPREGKVNLKQYKAADDALEAAKASYKSMPYDLQLHIVEGKDINAEAIPGYLYVQRKAVTDLGPEALQLVVGHEIAHVAKRHNSKQLQQRLIDVGIAQQLFEKMLKGTQPDQLLQFVQGESVLQKFTGVFAAYQQEHELQADGCAIREMVYAERDPLVARKEYVEKRGSGPQNAGAILQTMKVFKLEFSEHPDDGKRDEYFVEAKAHHVTARSTQANR
jgi:Zn-dependent protease with chaperone function